MHAGAEALLQPAVAALVALVLVHDAAPAEATRVQVVLAHAAPEEALAPVAARRSVVLAGRAVAADRAELADGGGGGEGRGRRGEHPGREGRHRQAPAQTHVWGLCDRHGRHYRDMYGASATDTDVTTDTCLGPLRQTRTSL